MHSTLKTLHSAHYTWGCIKTWYHFKIPKITLSFSQLVSSLETRSDFFPAFYGCEESLAESRVSPVVFISFHRLSCCIHFLSCSFHFAFIPFHIAFISFYFAFMSFHSGQVGIRPTAHVFVIFRFGGLCRLPSQASWLHEHVHIRARYRFCSSYRFLGRQRIGSVKVQAKLECNARGCYTIPLVILHSKLYTLHFTLLT